MRVAVLSLIILLFLFNSNKVYSGTVTMPSTLTTDTTDFVYYQAQEQHLVLVVTQEPFLFQL